MKGSFDPPKAVLRTTSLETSLLLPEGSALTSDKVKNSITCLNKGMRKIWIVLSRGGQDVKVDHIIIDNLGFCDGGSTPEFLLIIHSWEGYLKQGWDEENLPVPPST